MFSLWLPTALMVLALCPATDSAMIFSWWESSSAGCRQELSCFAVLATSSGGVIVFRSNTRDAYCYSPPDVTTFLFEEVSSLGCGENWRAWFYS